MKIIFSLAILLAIFAVSQASRFPQYERVAIELLKKGSADPNFYRRNAGRLGALVPGVQRDLTAFLNKNTRTLSFISKDMLPKVQKCGGNYKRLQQQAQVAFSPLMVEDGANCKRLMNNGKRVLKQMNTNQLTNNCMRVIPSLR